LFQTAAHRLAAKKNHYEVLGLPTDCTQKDIKNAFVTRSKECHPDKNIKNSSGVSDTESSQEFIKVMEAYQVLSKAHSRSNYDQALRGIHSVNYVTRDIMHEPWKVDPTSYTDAGPNYQPYYGVKGIKRMKNWKIVCACVIFCATGVLLQVIAITRSVTFKREQLDKYSAINSAKHEAARELAIKNGNSGQIDLLKLRMVKSEINFDKDEV
jgi:DnaJ homolog subfamily C member 4